VERELFTIPEQLSSPPVFKWGLCYSIFSFMCMFCRSLFVLLYFFFWRSTSGTRRLNLVTNPVISHERGKDREVFTTSGTYPLSFVTQIFHNSQPSHGCDSSKSIFRFMCMFCRSLFALLCFFSWSLCCLFFFDIRILITPLVSSDSSL
jgi:hypothetical protein